MHKSIQNRLIAVSQDVSVRQECRGGGVGRRRLGNAPESPSLYLGEVLVIICTPSAFQYIVSLVFVSYKVER